MSFFLPLKLRLLGALLLLIGSSPDVVAIESTWIGGPAGSWTEATNWSTGLVPGGTFTNVIIDDDPAASSAVTLASSLTIGDVTLDAGDQLGIESGATLTADFVTVDGDLFLQAAATLRPQEFLWIQSNGHLSMTDNLAQTGSAVIGSNGAVLWNQGRISGAGAIGSGMPSFNEGFIVGDLPGEILSAIIYSTSNSNTGEMLAINGGSLLIRSSTSISTLYNSESGDDGLIQARGTNSTVRVENVAIMGGEISTAADEANVHGSVILTQATLGNNVRLEGNITGGRVALQGTVENNTIVNFTTGGPTPQLYIVSPSVLTGNGRMEMGRYNVDAFGFSSNSDPSLVNDVDHTIAGAGMILTTNFHFKNRGTVEAHPVLGDSEMSVLLSTTQTMVNSGTMRATDQATLRIGETGQNIVFENYEGDDEGAIEADVNSTVRIGNGVTIRGGVLRSVTPTEPDANTVAGKIVSNSGSATLRDVRLEGTIGDLSSFWSTTGEIENTGVFIAYISVENEVTFTGGGRLQLSGGTRIRGGINPVQLINIDNTIAGTGTIDVVNYSFRNRGAIVAETFSSQLTIAGNSIAPGSGFFNSGLLKATNGATLTVQAAVTNFEGSNKGTIHADDASFVRVLNVNGGVLSTSGSGEIVTGLISSLTTLRDVHNQGLLRISGNTDFAGTMQNDGTIINDPNDIVRLTGSLARLTGTGTYGPLSAPMNIAVGQLSPTMFIHGPDHTIRGHGTISVLNGGFINEGTVIAEGNGSVDITMANGTIMRQQGSLNALELSYLNVKTSSAKFTNEGTMVADGHVTVLQQLSQPLDVINASGATVRGLGTFHLAAPDANPLTFSNEAGGTINGGLSFNFDGVSDIQPKLFRNSGLISPDGHHDSQAQLFMNANFMQSATGVLDFELGGTPGSGWYDALRIQGGDMSLAGTLKVSIVEAFEPSIGDTYSMLSAGLGTVSGMFDTFVPTQMNGKWMSLVYLPNEVQLSINAITADFDGNGFVDGADLDEWQLASQSGTAAGDADGDGDSDGRDFLAWQRQYGAGIDPLAASVAVPEPSTIVLLILSMAGFLVRRVR
jgi:hypothetical protein